MIYIDFNTELLMNFTRIIKGANFSIFYPCFRLMKNYLINYYILSIFCIVYLM